MLDSSPAAAGNHGFPAYETADKKGEQTPPIDKYHALTLPIVITIPSESPHFVDESKKIVKRPSGKNPHS
ncbi:MAG: hypothetical protein GVY26_15910 [Bacteroidetes bacterium]|jgi:hypothetical protein|nr:hypothetical protein [Bacteroidota bacterium]